MLLERRHLLKQFLFDNDGLLSFFQPAKPDLLLFHTGEPLIEPGKDCVQFRFRAEGWQDSLFGWWPTAAGNCFLGNGWQHSFFIIMNNKKLILVHANMGQCHPGADVDFAPDLPPGPAEKLVF